MLTDVRPYSADHADYKQLFYSEAQISGCQRHLNQRPPHSIYPVGTKDLQPLNYGYQNVAIDGQNYLLASEQIGGDDSDYRYNVLFAEGNVNNRRSIISVETIHWARETHGAKDGGHPEVVVTATLDSATTSTVRARTFMDFSGIPSEVQFLHHYQGMNRRKPYDKISIRPNEVYIVLGREWIVKGTTLKDVEQRHDVSVKVNLQDGGLHTSVNKGAQEKQLQDKESILWQGDITNSQSAFYPHAQVVLTDNQLIINGVNVQWSLPVPPVNISIPAWSTQNACNDYGKLVRAAMSTFSQLSDHYQIQSAGLNVAF